MWVNECQHDRLVRRKLGRLGRHYQCEECKALVIPQGTFLHLLDIIEAAELHGDLFDDVRARERKAGALVGWVRCAHCGEMARVDSKDHFVQGQCRSTKINLRDEDDILAEMEAEAKARSKYLDWDASGSLGYRNVSELLRRTRADAVEKAAQLCELEHAGNIAEKIRGLIPTIPV